ncbi:uncharacterized protein LOC105209999 [Zeugodacus cucurbitae]|uniref:Cytospin-A n=1 Tax=Zeugodacus cucurbitae TaxID=28588 RepID=A0A0A1WMM1_ZEUCU|nr:uncharacterized protein LOC105209999 [Zeugodacus cucurbitae]
MKFLVLLAAILLCVQAYHIPYGFYDGSSESSEEEYRVLVTSNNQPPLSLPGVGVYSQPILQAVKVKVPRFVSPELKQQIITQTLAARGLTLHTPPPQQSGTVNVAPTAGLFVRQQRALPLATVETGDVADNVVITGEEKVSPIVPIAPAGLSTPVVPEELLFRAILDA